VGNELLGASVNITKQGMKIMKSIVGNLNFSTLTKYKGFQIPQHQKKYWQTQKKK